MNFMKDHDRYGTIQRIERELNPYEELMLEIHSIELYLAEIDYPDIGQIVKPNTLIDQLWREYGIQY